MSFISLNFVFFLFVALVIYWRLPEKYRNVFLLLVGIAFVASSNWISILFLLAQILISFFVGRRAPNRPPVLYVSLILLLGILFVAKYTDIPAQVVGISFYTLQTISYIIDVYRKDVEAEKNIITYALYVSFFPQLLAGPIAKAKEQIKRYEKQRFFKSIELEKALILIFYGLFLKLVIADRAAIFVDAVYANISEAGRIEVLVAVCLYSIQIYGDFAGYSLIAIGIGRCFGIELPENFKRPYFAKSCNDFWKRWHISLTSWFRDYLYFPLGGNRKGKTRTFFNILVVFVVSGVWHGAGMTFMIWGLLHGCLQIVERLFLGEKKMGKFLTFIWISLLWVFFRANTVSQAAVILKSIVVNSNGFGIKNITSHGLNIANILLLLIMVIVMTVIDVLSERKVKILDYVLGLKLSIRWLILYALIFSVLIFGIYGPGYDAANFIYNAF